jgi:hypothetical protein
LLEAAEQEWELFVSKNKKKINTLSLFNSDIKNRLTDLETIYIVKLFATPQQKLEKCYCNMAYWREDALK